MSASVTLLSSVQTVEGTIKQQRTAYARGVRDAIADEKRAALRAGQYGLLAKATFTADEVEAWKVWAVEVFRKSYKTVESYLAVAKAYEASPKAVQASVKDWTFEALQAFASVEADDRKAVVEAVKAEDSNPSPDVVRAAREIVKDSKLSDSERSEKAKAKAKREKETAASKTVELADALKPLLKGIKTDGEFKALSVGIELGRAGHDEKILADAIKQVRQQREAGTAAVQTAAAKLAADAS